MKNKTSGNVTSAHGKKGKIIGSTISVIAALVCLGLAIFCFCNVSAYTGKEQKNLLGNAIFFLVAFVLLMCLAHVLIKSHMKYNTARGYCKTIYVISFLFYYLSFAVVLLVGLIILAVRKWINSPSSSSSDAKVTAKDEYGKEHQLSYYSQVGSIKYYKDEAGNEWKTDDGKKFTPSE